MRLFPYSQQLTLFDLLLILDCLLCDRRHRAREVEPGRHHHCDCAEARAHHGIQLCFSRAQQCLLSQPDCELSQRLPPLPLPLVTHQTLCLHPSYSQTSPAGISQDPTNKDYLSTPPPKLTGPLARAIEDTWGSLTTFKSAMSSAALGMSSSGYVWLVVDGLGHLGIVPTFGAGTVLVQNRRQKGPAGLQGLAAGSLEEQERQAAKEGEEGYASPGAPDEAKEQPSRSLYDPSAQQPSSTASALKPDIYAGLGSAMASNPEDDVGQTLTPLLCMSGYEHAWLPDWGVWGKETYLARFWEVVDWEKVEGIWQQHRDAGAAERSWRVR